MSYFLAVLVVCLLCLVCELSIRLRVSEKRSVKLQSALQGECDHLHVICDQLRASDDAHVRAVMRLIRFCEIRYGVAFQRDFPCPPLGHEQMTDVCMGRISQELSDFEARIKKLTEVS